jgi:hypothetical protein
VDASVEVIISSTLREENSKTDYHGGRPGSGQGPSQANMIISVWHLDEAKYFTLTFTSAHPHTAPAETRASSRTVARSITSIGKPHGSVSSNSSSRRSLGGNAGTNSPSSTTSPLIRTPGLLPHGPPSATSSHSVFQKASQLKASFRSVICDQKLT